jgi:hypothetical protein
MPPNPTPVTRRAVLLGAAGLAGTAALAACSSSGSSAAGSGANGVTSNKSKGPIVVPLFDVGEPYVVTGSRQRLVLGLQGDGGATATHLPADASIQLLKGLKDPKPVGDPVAVKAHSDGTPIAYYPIELTFPSTGFFALELTVQGKSTSQAVQVFTPGQAKMVQRGDKMRPVDTPTPADHRGVEPICTRQPECSLHGVTLTQALAKGQPTAFLISTPQFCQIGVCGPSLDLLIEAAPKYPGIQFLHAEVYEDAEKLGSIQGAKLAPAVVDYDLTYEPVLFVVDGQGVLVDRLDNVFDRADIKKALDQVA